MSAKCGTCLGEHPAGLYPHAGIMLPATEFDRVTALAETHELLARGRAGWKYDPTTWPREGYERWLTAGILSAVRRKGWGAK